MSAQYLPLEAWHLIKHTAIKHPPKIVGAAAAFFIFQVIMGRLRSSRWFDALLLATITTTLLVFVVASVYLLVTRPGYRLM